MQTNTRDVDCQRFIRLNCDIKNPDKPAFYFMQYFIFGMECFCTEIIT